MNLDSVTPNEDGDIIVHKKGDVQSIVIMAPVAVAEASGEEREDS